MSRDRDSFVFQRVTDGLRKPTVRFRLASGRRVELLGFHLEPGWAFDGEGGSRPIARAVLRRLYPNEEPIFVSDPERTTGPAWLCAAYLYSDTPRSGIGALGYSVLLICGFLNSINSGVQGMVCELLSRIEWEAVATDDVMW